MYVIKIVINLKTSMYFQSGNLPDRFINSWLAWAILYWINSNCWSIIITTSILERLNSGDVGCWATSDVDFLSGSFCNKFFVFCSGDNHKKLFNLAKLLKSNVLPCSGTSGAPGRLSVGWYYLSFCVWASDNIKNRDLQEQAKLSNFECF